MMGHDMRATVPATLRQGGGAPASVGQRARFDVEEGRAKGEGTPPSLLTSAERIKGGRGVQETARNDGSLGGTCSSTRTAHRTTRTATCTGPCASRQSCRLQL